MSAAVVPAPPPAAAGGRWQRLLGLDVARAVAVLGMVMVHVGPLHEPGVGGTLYQLPHGRASILFVLLAGMGAGLLAGRRSGAERRRLWLRLALRALVLLPLGLALQLLDHGVLVILQAYAVFFVVAGLAALLPDRVVLGAAGVLVLIGPVVRLGAELAWPALFDHPPVALGDPPGVVLRGLLLTGPYPVMVWSAPLLAGVWLGRRDLTAPALRRWLVGAGAVMAAGAWVAARGLQVLVDASPEEPSWAQLVLDAPHSQMPLWVLGATGSALAVVGLALAAADRFPRASWPLAAMGQLALTVYVGHLLVLHLRTGWLRVDDLAGAAGSVARFAVVVLVLATAWRALLPRGPLEAVLRLPEQGWARAARRR